MKKLSAKGKRVVITTVAIIIAVLVGGLSIVAEQDILSSAAFSILTFLLIFKVGNKLYYRVDFAPSIGAAVYYEDKQFVLLLPFTILTISW